MKITTTSINERQRECILCTGSKKCKNIYIQKAGHFVKSRIICITCFYTKILTLYVIFHGNWEVGIYIYIYKAWHFSLNDVFINKNPDTSQKARHLVLHFHIQKDWHFALLNFHGNFEIGRGKGGFYMHKTRHFV